MENLKEMVAASSVEHTAEPQELSSWCHVFYYSFARRQLIPCTVWRRLPHQLMTLVEGHKSAEEMKSLSGDTKVFVCDFISYRVRRYRVLPTGREFMEDLCAEMREAQVWRSSVRPGTKIDMYSIKEKKWVDAVVVDDHVKVSERDSDGIPGILRLEQETQVPLRCSHIDSEVFARSGTHTGKKEMFGDKSEEQKA